MKTFKQYLSEIQGPTYSVLTPVKIDNQEKKDIARKASDEVEAKMVKKYQLPTKVV